MEENLPFFGGSVTGIATSVKLDGTFSAFSVDLVNY